MKTCSICQMPIDVIGSDWTDGHNAEPVNSGRCCSTCNAVVVIPARLNQMYGNRNGAPSPQPAAHHRRHGSRSRRT